ncbi:MAG: alpha/beta fold hydrolase [Burkholderiaceae bacterium]
MNARSFGTGVEVCGSGPPLVLIHGVGLDRSTWQDAMPWLEPHFRVIRYDLVGQGESPATGSALGTTEFVDQLRELLDRLGVERAHLIGFSLGGVIARAWAASHPGRTNRLVILASIAPRGPEQRTTVATRLDALARGGVAATLGSALERWFTPAFAAAHPEVLDRVRRVLLGNDPVGYLAAFRYFATCDDELDAFGPKILAPTLVVTGEHDSGSTPEMTHRIAAGIRDARTAILPGLRHMAVVESPAIALEPIVSFLLGPGRDPLDRIPPSPKRTA